MANVHQVKCLQGTFRAILNRGSGDDIRFNDRDFKVGDSVILTEVRERKLSYRSVVTNSYYDECEITGYEVECVILHITKRNDLIDKCKCSPDVVPDVISIFFRILNAEGNYGK